MPSTCDDPCCSPENLNLLLDYLQRWSFGDLIQRHEGELITRQSAQWKTSNDSPS